MSPREERHWLEEKKASLVFLERDFRFSGRTDRLFYLPIRIAVLPAQKANQVGMDLEGGSQHSSCRPASRLPPIDQSVIDDPPLRHRAACAQNGKRVICTLASGMGEYPFSANARQCNCPTPDVRGHHPGSIFLGIPGIRKAVF